MKSFQDLCHQSENLGRFEQINVYTIESNIYISKLYYEDDQEDLIFLGYTQIFWNQDLLKPQLYMSKTSWFAFYKWRCLLCR